MFEEAREALQEKLEQGAQGEKGAPEIAGEQQAASQELVDLDSMPKFRFLGKEWSKDDLKSSIMRHDDYTKKSQALARDRQSYDSVLSESKFVDNLAADIANVLANPGLAAKFKEIYPAKYHSVLESSLKQLSPSTPEIRQDQGPKSDPLMEQRLSQIESSIKQAQVEATEAAIDSVFNKMNQKYPMADEELVIARAQALMDKGVKLIDAKGNQDEGVWEKIWKSVNDATKERFDGHYKKQVSEQKSANVKARDVASGGGIPAQAPKKVPLKDVANHVIETLSSR